MQFETDGMVYNLGVIDNKQSGSNEPVNDYTTTLSLNHYIKIALAIILLIILFVCFPWIFKVLWWIISAPFKFVAWIVKSVKKSKQKKNTHKKGHRK